MWSSSRIYYRYRIFFCCCFYQCFMAKEEKLREKLQRKLRLLIKLHLAVQWWRKGLKLLAHAIHIQLQTLICSPPSQPILFETINNNGILKSNKSFFQYISLSLLLVMMLHVKWAGTEKLRQKDFGEIPLMCFSKMKKFSSFNKFWMHWKFKQFTNKFHYCKFNSIRKWGSFDYLKLFKRVKSKNKVKLLFFITWLNI